MEGHGHIWAVFFSGIVSFQYHPGVLPGDRLSLKECATVADAMMILYAEREAIWRG